MKLDRTPMTILLLLAAVAAVQMVHYYPLLPERLAVHFGASGEPNGWSSKGEFMVLFGAMEAFFVLFGVGLAFALDRIPVALINVRNKDYWFSPERREESLEFLKNRILWIETATLGFLVALAQILFRENLGDAPPRLSGDFWYVMIVFVVAVLWLALQIVLRFRPPKERASL
ncbi:MAG: DUF1648 domain-containing protein [Candidatus Eisenbacteria bacterium]|nr:DUF1648 domain-containing protein [Candidatus Eisenbacteria bacterium]